MARAADAVEIDTTALEPGRGHRRDRDGSRAARTAARVADEPPAQPRPSTSRGRRRGRRGWRPRRLLAVVGRPERRQIHPGEPDPRQPAGGGRGYPRRHQGPGQPTTPPGAAGPSRWWTPAAGSPRSKASPALAARVAAQARVAVDAADAVLFVVDAVVGRDRRRRGRRGGAAPLAQAGRRWRPTRSTTPPASRRVHSLWSLGLGEPVSVSALHGRGSGDLLDAVLDALPEAPQDRVEAEGGPRRVALIGRPNVGKSSLLNKLAGQETRAGRRGRRHDPRPGRRAHRAGRRTLAVRRHRGHPAPGARVTGRGLLRRAAHRAGPGARRGRGRAGRRQRAPGRAGPADHLDGDRRGPGAGHRLQQVGPGRRGPAASRSTGRSTGSCTPPGGRLG